MTEFKCRKCGFNARNSTSFMDDETPFTPSLDCPKCGCSDIIES